MSFKSKFYVEGYLGTISNRPHSLWYTKIIIWNHRFAVEIDNLAKYLVMKCCSFCKAQQKPSVEEEMHVLIHCPRYAPLRKDLYDFIHDLCPNLKSLRDSHKFN